MYAGCEGAALGQFPELWKQRVGVRTDRFQTLGRLARHPDASSCNQVGEALTQIAFAELRALERLARIVGRNKEIPRRIQSRHDRPPETIDHAEKEQRQSDQSCRAAGDMTCAVEEQE